MGENVQGIHRSDWREIRKLGRKMTKTYKQLKRMLKIEDDDGMHMKIGKEWRQAKEERMLKKNQKITVVILI